MSELTYLSPPVCMYRLTLLLVCYRFIILKITWVLVATADSHHSSTHLNPEHRKIPSQWFPDINSKRIMKKKKITTAAKQPKISQNIRFWDIFSIWRKKILMSVSCRGCIKLLYFVSACFIAPDVCLQLYYETVFTVWKMQVEYCQVFDCSLLFCPLDVTITSSQLSLPHTLMVKSMHRSRYSRLYLFCPCTMSKNVDFVLHKDYWMLPLEKKPSIFISLIHSRIVQRSRQKYWRKSQLLYIFW